MKYRKFGNTGVEVSILGLGTMRLPGYKEGNKYIDQKNAIRYWINKKLHLILCLIIFIFNWGNEISNDGYLKIIKNKRINIINIDK